MNEELECPHCFESYYYELTADGEVCECPSCRKTFRAIMHVTVTTHKLEPKQ